jgi:tetratricopeptide (TPR) repeat protein
VVNIENLRKGQDTVDQLRSQIGPLEQQYRSSPTNLSNALNLALAYFQLQQTNRGIQVLDQLIAQPQPDMNTLLTVAQAYAQLGYATGLEYALGRLVTIAPENPEAWYDLAAIQATLSRTNEAVASLGRAMQLSNQRLAQQPKAKNLAALATLDDKFATLRTMPQFQRLFAPK